MAAVDRPPLALLVLVGAMPVVSLLGLLAEIGLAHGLEPSVGEFFALSYEANLPTAYSSLLLATSALTLARVGWARRVRQLAGARGFFVLAVLMAYVSIDEAIELHESLARLYAGRGLLYFGWVVPGAAIVLGLALLLLPWLVRLPPATRRAFLIAASIYVFGALGMELPLGLYTERYGDQGLGYGLIDWVEESLEMLGASLFLLAVHRDLREVRA